jgi:hypothetical protein
MLAGTRSWASNDSDHPPHASPSSLANDIATTLIA